MRSTNWSKHQLSRQPESDEEKMMGQLVSKLAFIFFATDFRGEVFVLPASAKPLALQQWVKHLSTG
jgi:hypothetical protein